MTKIEWTQKTWNPIVGCSLKSPGCTNCYAMAMAARIEAMNAEIRPGHKAAAQYDGTTRKMNGKAVWTGKLALAEHTLLLPLKRKVPTTWFVNSMGDLFHEDCPDDWIDKVFAVMALTPQHTYQVLTKRSARMRAYFKPFDSRRADSLGTKVLELGYDGPLELLPWPLPNVWLGVSTERQQEADERIPDLLATPAAVRFISAEPLLGPIDLTSLDINGDGEMDALNKQSPEQVWTDQWAPEVTGTSLEEAIEAFEEWGFSYPPSETPLPRLDWVITGGESGPGARPANPQWFRDIRDQCREAGVAYFHKQNGAWVSVSEVEGDREHFRFPDGRTVRRLGDTGAGRALDGLIHDEYPERPR